jgi:organic radical activating enzyme
VDDELIDAFHMKGYKLAIETNGTHPVSSKIDWITLSPKTAEHAVRQKFAHELKYVRSYGMGIPKPSAEAEHYLISPAFEGDQLPEKNLEWCTKLVNENPPWKLSLQKHKFWKIR